MKSVKIILVLLVLLSISGCTSQQRAKKYGGTAKVELDRGQRLLEVTWKGDELWYLTEPMDDSYVPKEKVFQEKSSMGIIEGKVIFVESK